MAPPCDITGRLRAAARRAHRRRRRAVGPPTTAQHGL